MNKFWNFSPSEDGMRTLYLEGAISDETWFGDEVTPATFKADLSGGSGDITVWINSPGGVFHSHHAIPILSDPRSDCHGKTGYSMRGDTISDSQRG